MTWFGTLILFHLAASCILRLVVRSFGNASQKFYVGAEFALSSIDLIELVKRFE